MHLVEVGVVGVGLAEQILKVALIAGQTLNLQKKNKQTNKTFRQRVRLVMDVCFVVVVVVVVVVVSVGDGQGRAWGRPETLADADGIVTN